MASVVTSFRNAGAASFDLIETAAVTAARLLTTASRAVDALDDKARLMAATVAFDTKAQLVNAKDEAITRAATDHADMMEEAHRKNFPGQDFDRGTYYNAALAKITAAVA